MLPERLNSTGRSLREDHYSTLEKPEGAVGYTLTCMENNYVVAADRDHRDLRYPGTSGLNILFSFWTQTGESKCIIVDLLDGTHRLIIAVILQTSHPTLRGFQQTHQTVAIREVCMKKRRNCSERDCPSHTPIAGAERSVPGRPGGKCQKRPSICMLLRLASAAGAAHHLGLPRIIITCSID